MMKIDGIKIVTDGDGGKIDAWQPKEGRCVVRFATEKVDGAGNLYTKEAFANAVTKMVDEDLPLPVKLDSGSEVGEVVGCTMYRDGTVTFDLKIDTAAYPDLWRGISNGWITDVSMSVEE